MAEKILLALSTFPDAETARRISNQLVSERFAACANILSAVESIYRWKEKIETGSETLVLFKLSEDRQSAFQEKLRSLHPYEVPEIITVPVSSGLPDYLHWVHEHCGSRLNGFKPSSFEMRLPTVASGRREKWPRRSRPRSRSR